MRYDIAIIGTGPAGLEAAINAKIRNKSVLLLGEKSLSDKLLLAPKIDNYLGLPGKSGVDMAEDFKNHLKEMDIEITEQRVKQIYPFGSYFGLVLDKGTAEATTVIIATGIVHQKNLPGEEDLLGYGVGYCATCDGPLYRNKRVVLVGEYPEAEEDVTYMAELCSKVYYVPLYEACGVADTDKIEVVRAKPIKVLGEELDGPGKHATGLVVESENAEKTVESENPEKTVESENPEKTVTSADPETIVDKEGTEKVLAADGVFFLKKTVPVESLLPGLDMREDDKAAIKVERNMSTSVPGVFAAGDCTGKPYQYMKAAGEGLVAGQAAVTYLAKMEQAN